MKTMKFDLYKYMADILINFCDNNNLEHLSASEIAWKTEEQRVWLERFIDVWDRLEDRYRAQHK